MKKQIWEQLTCFLMAPMSWCGVGQLSPLEWPRSLTHQPGPVALECAPPHPSSLGTAQKKVVMVRADLWGTFLKGEYCTSEPVGSVGIEASWSLSIISPNRECHRTVIVLGDLMIQGSFLVNRTNCSSLCSGPFSPFCTAGE